MTRTLLATALVVLLPVALQAQSLAGVAKKAEAESAKAKQAEGKNADKPATKVYTDKDLPDVPAPTATSVSPETVGSKATTTTGSTTSGSTTSGDEASWRSRASELRRRLADDRTKLAAAKMHFDKLPDQAKGAIETPVVDAWMRAREDISRLTAVVVNDERAISELEDEARRAGVPPGWLRER
jgi:hypothetical protein